MDVFRDVNLMDFIVNLFSIVLSSLIYLYPCNGKSASEG